MIRRLIASLLVFAVLGYGTSWAYAGHAFADADHTIEGVHKHSQAASDEGGCDHCCHASAHMLGLAHPFPGIHPPDVDMFGLVAGVFAATPVCAPPLKPPRS